MLYFERYIQVFLCCNAAIPRLHTSKHVLKMFNPHCLLSPTIGWYFGNRQLIKRSNVAGQNL